LEDFDKKRVGAIAPGIFAADSLYHARDANCPSLETAPAVE
jgi:hypothetical protein